MAEGIWKSIATLLVARIRSGEWAPGTRLPSGDALARELGVNRNVAHRAVEELQRQGLVVRRQGSGTVVAPQAQKKSARVALLVDGYSAVHNFPSGDLLRGVGDRIGDDSTLVIADSKHDVGLEARQLRRLAREADGILLYATAPERPTSALTGLLDAGYPVVALDRLPCGVDVDAVVTDNRGAVESVVRTLLTGGHRRIGFLGFRKPAFSSVAERFEGYFAALEAAGLADPALVRWLPEEAGRDDAMLGDLVADAILALRHGSAPVTALVCAEDGLGCAAVPACERLGLALPADLEIAAFSDWHPMTLRTPWNVRRLVQRKYDLGAAAAGLLLDRLASPGRPTEVVRVPADIIPADADYNGFASPTAILAKEGTF